MPRPITSRLHGMLDYPVGIVLIAAPWIFGFSDADNEAAYLVPIIIGALIIAQSLITDYELSVADVLPLRAHLMLDLVLGIVLAASPWIFGFSDEGANAWLPHLIVGLGIVASALMTQHHRETAPGSRHVGRQHRPA
jgi:hypothetical protein